MCSNQCELNWSVRCQVCSSRMTTVGETENGLGATKCVYTNVSSRFWVIYENSMCLECAPGTFLLAARENVCSP